MIYSIVSTTFAELEAAANTEIAPKTYSWTMRVVSDAPANVAVGAPGATDVEADEEDFAVTEYKEALIAVPANCEVSVYSEAGGKVWVSEVKCSA